MGPEAESINRALDALALADETLARVAEGDDERRVMANREARLLAEKGSVAAQGVSPVSRAVRAPGGQAMDPESSAAWNKWANDKIEAFSAVLGDEVGRSLKHEREAMRKVVEAARTELEDRARKQEEATVELLLAQEKQIAELERRLAELEQRAILQPSKPRLIAYDGGSDAAD